MPLIQQIMPAITGLPPIAQLELFIQVNPQFAGQLFRLYQQSITTAVPKPP
jgi:hypothetical protein